MYVIDGGSYVFFESCLFIERGGGEMPKDIHSAGSVWSRYFDKTTGRHYYHNDDTNEVSSLYTLQYQSLLSFISLNYLLINEVLPRIIST